MPFVAFFYYIFHFSINSNFIRFTCFCLVQECTNDFLSKEKLLSFMIEFIYMNIFNQVHRYNYFIYFYILDILHCLFFSICFICVTSWKIHMHNIRIRIHKTFNVVPSNLIINKIISNINNPYFFSHAFFDWYVWIEITLLDVKMDDPWKKQSKLSA